MQTRIIIILCLYCFCVGGVFAAASCNINITSFVNFGVYNPNDNRADDSNGSLQVNCNGSRPPSIVIFEVSMGMGSSNSYRDRSLRLASHQLIYNLYLNAAHNRIWGNGAMGTGTWRGFVRINQKRTRTIYGRLFAGQYVDPGIYQDTISVTLRVLN